MHSGRRGDPASDPEARHGRLQFFGIDERDIRELAAMREIGTDEIDSIVDRFYEHLLGFPELAQLLHSEPGRLGHLRETQRRHFLTILDGALAPGYFEDRLRVGDAHQRIGLEPHWYIGAYSYVLCLALRTLARHTGDGQRMLPGAEALVKHVLLEISLAIDTYIYGGFVSREVARDLERAASLAEESMRSMAEVDRMKDELSAMVVHDLKNPVNGISMLTQLILRKGGDLPTNVRGWLQQIERTCREMTRLIQNLLEIAKLEEGRMPVALEAVDLDALIGEVVAEFAPIASEAGLVLGQESAAGLPPVHADRALLRRALVNLVVNALRHSGSPDVCVRAGPGDEPPSGGGPRWVEIQVCDHGRGFSVEEQARVFEKFRVVRRSPADEPGGDTGLGLPFCRLAIEQMGGRITIRSRPGDETVFSIRLPAEPASHL